MLSSHKGADLVNKAHQCLQNEGKDVAEVYELVEACHAGRHPGRLLEWVCRVVPICVIYLEWRVKVEAVYEYQFKFDTYVKS